MSRLRLSESPRAGYVIRSRRYLLPSEREGIGRALETARLDSGFSVREISLALGMSRSYFRRVERGEYLPTLEKLCLWARYLGAGEALAEALNATFLDVPSFPSRKVKRVRAPKRAQMTLPSIPEPAPVSSNVRLSYRPRFEPRPYTPDPHARGQLTQAKSMFSELFKNRAEYDAEP